MHGTCDVISSLKTTHMSHILLPTDLSDRSLKAATLAIELFGTEGNTYTLLHAYTSIGLADPMAPPQLPDVERVHAEGLEAFEQKLRSTCDLGTAHVRRIVSFGPLPSAVDDLAREQDVDLVVLTTSGGRSTFLGSHATGIIQGTRVPVLEIPAEVTSLSFRKVLFADDRSAIDPHALDILAAIVRMTGSELLILHVATGKPLGAQTDNAALLARVFAGVRQRSIVVENNNVEETLFDVAAREQVDLIAVLHRHTGLLEGLLHKSTTKAVALHSPIPVLALEQ